MNAYSEPRSSCPICDSHDAKVVFEQHFEAISGEVNALTEYNVSLCNQCKMLYANNIPSQRFFDQYYLSGTKYEKPDLSEVVSDYHKFCVSCIADISSRHDNITDVGCGYGTVLRKLNEMGYEHLTAIDPSQINGDNLKNAGIKGLPLSLFGLDCEYAKEQDIVVVMALLEHVVDLHGAIRNISKLVSDKGMFFITVPDADQFRLTSRNPFQEFSIEHVNYFDIRSLSLLMSLHGYQLHQQWDFTGIITASYMKKPYPLKYMDEYIGDCLKNVSSIIYRMKMFAESRDPVIIWGCGTLTRYLLANTDFNKLNIVAIVDSNEHYWGKHLLGHIIISPSKLKEDMYKNSVILISTYAHNKEIRSVLKDMMNSKNEIISLLEEE